MILEYLSSRTGAGVEFIGVGVESKSEIRDSAHLCHLCGRLMLSYQ